MIFNMSEALPQKPSEGKDENRRWKSLPAHSTCLIFHIISRAMCVCVCFSPLCPGEIPKNYKNGNIFFSVLPTPHRLARVPDVDVSSISFSIFIHEARQGNNNVHPPSGPNTHIHMYDRAWGGRMENEIHVYLFADVCGHCIRVGSVWEAFLFFFASFVAGVSQSHTFFYIVMQTAFKIYDMN